MKNLLLLALALGCFGGCALKRYDVHLNGNNIITAKTKPKLVRGFYVFKDTEGKPMEVSASRVRSIEARTAFQKQTHSEFTGKFEYR